ncbi:nucleoside deaminase [Candidatus Entotheonella palauensis]|uniref:nucleoside deaminase n=1 Tax=Candidatus Entotheonella palauensis TaxID=93172 RepID=UPI000B7E4CB7|nr:nucleoside deaminase [Candidatus Entotheonella palauensis]
MPADHEHMMRIALEEAAQGGAEGNSAVGSIIVDGDQVVARGRNLVTSNSDPTAHAETVALRDAGAALKRTDFSGMTLYTTFEPCPMCCGAILASGIATLVMGARHDPAQGSWGGYTVESLVEMTNRADQLTVVTGILTRECADVRNVETR